jgi:uncharacterized protein involved in exopolysaccharide biosynthesis
MITRNSSYGHSGTAGTKAAPGVRDLCRVFYRHKRKMVVAFCSTLALCVLGLIVFPRTYTSESRLFIRIGKESVALDPTATTNQTIEVNETRESEINSELEILRSRVLLEDVVDELGTDYVLSRDGEKQENGWVDTLFTTVSTARTWLTGEITATEQAISALERSIEVSSPRKSSVVVVKCDARNPELAQRILQAYLDAYVTRHAQANHTSGSHDFFVEQSELVSEELLAAGEELRDAKNQNGIASVEGQRANVEAQSNVIEVAILENQRALSSSEAKITALKRILSELPEQQLAEESMIPSAAADAMRNELYKVQIQEKEASARYTALHPHVIALRRQVEETRKILASEEAQRNHPTRKLSVVHQAVQTDLATAQASIAAQKAEADSLKQQFEAVQTKIRALNNNELRITELSRKVDLLEISYKTYTVNREQARINAALEVERISNINVVQPASFVAKPSSPRIRLTLALAMLLATFASLLVALAAEYLDQSLRSPDQVERELGVPVLFSVPRGTRHELIQN